MIKKSVLDQITMSADGTLSLKFLKQVIDDDGTVLVSVPHRGVAESWEDANKVMAFHCERLALKHAEVEKSDKDWLASVTKTREIRPKK